MVEGGKILSRAPAARDDDDINFSRPVEITDSCAHLCGRGFTLHLRWVNEHAGTVMPAAQDVQDVA